MIDIFIIQETQLKLFPDYYKGYKIFMLPKQAMHLGLIIGIKDNKLTGKTKTKFTNLAGSAITIEIFLNNGKNIFLSNLHLKHGSRVDECIKFLDEVEANLPEHIICGDFNAHHPSWGSKFQDSHGNAINDWVDRKNLIICNTKYKYFIFTQKFRVIF